MNHCQGPERVAWEVFDAADTDGSGDLNQEEIASLVVKLWDCIGRAMPPSYESRIPAVVQDTLAQYDSAGRGAIR